jgi:hypothetical protein
MTQFHRVLKHEQEVINSIGQIVSLSFKHPFRIRCRGRDFGVHVLGIFRCQDFPPRVSQFKFDSILSSVGWCQITLSGEAGSAPSFRTV